MARTLLLSVLMLISTPLLADTENEISTLLDYYAEMWNQEDTDFLGSYFHPEFVLISDDGTISRKQHVDSIKQIGQNGGDRGELDYSNIKVKKLGDSHAVAYGVGTLKFDDGSSIESRFSTVYEKTPFGWKALLTRN